MTLKELNAKKESLLKDMITILCGHSFDGDNIDINLLKELRDKLDIFIMEYAYHLGENDKAGELKAAQKLIDDYEANYKNLKEVNQSLKNEISVYEKQLKQLREKKTPDSDKEKKQTNDELKAYGLIFDDEALQEFVDNLFADSRKDK